MKTRLITVGFILFSLFLLSFQLPSKFISRNDEKVEVYFDNSLNFNDLVKTKLELVQKDIILNYESLEFNKEGKLTLIGFSVKSEGKYCGSGKTSDLSTKYGFIIDKNPKADIYFQVGVRKL